MPGEMTTTERRVLMLEARSKEDEARIKALEMLAGKAAQDAGLGMGGGGGGGGSPARLCFTTSVVSARVGSTVGTGTFQFVTNVAGVLTATGSPGDSGITGVNLTGGVGPNSAFGLVEQVGSDYIFVVIDCLSTTNPGTPASTTPTGT